MEVHDKDDKDMKLTPGCVLAYSVNEINVGLSDGTFQLVLERDNKGGFKGEEQEENPDVLGKASGKMFGNYTNNNLSAICGRGL